MRDAEHGESSPEAKTLLITQLSCSLYGEQETISILPDSLASAAYGRETATEQYRCNYGLNPAYHQTITESGLNITCLNQDGDIRIIELANHPHFMGTLFLPQLNSTAEQPHPIIEAFLRAAC